MTEDFIGQYKLDRLVYSAEGVQLALISVGRYAPGTEGMFDLAVMPAYDSVMVVRQGGGGSSTRCRLRKSGKPGPKMRSSTRVSSSQGSLETR